MMIATHIDVIDKSVSASHFKESGILKYSILRGHTVIQIKDARVTLSSAGSDSRRLHTCTLQHE